METYQITLIIVFIFLSLGIFLLQGFKKIPVPYIGQVTQWGERIPGEYRKEGWTFLPLYPFWYGLILIKMERISFEVIVEKVRTPDRAESKIPVLVTIRPIPDKLTEYINSGKEEGVKKQLTGKIQERVREWCMGTEEGPSDWLELNQSQLEGTSVLVKKIASNSLTEMPGYAQDVPTWIWLRFFSRPQPKKFLKNEEFWGNNNWKMVNDILKKIKDDQGEKGISCLIEMVEKRRKEISSLRTGTGKIIIEDLGIVIERLNIGDIDVLGEVAKQAENEAKEEQERKGEALEIKFVAERISELMSPPLNFTRTEARDIVQTERAKVAKAINDHQISLDATTAEIIAKIFKR